MVASFVELGNMSVGQKKKETIKANLSHVSFSRLCHAYSRDFMDILYPEGGSYFDSCLVLTPLWLL